MPNVATLKTLTQQGVIFNQHRQLTEGERIKYDAHSYYTAILEPSPGWIVILTRNTTENTIICAVWFDDEQQFFFNL